MTTARLSLTMNTLKIHRPDAAPETPSARADRFAVWALLVLGLLLMLASIGKAEQPTATRVVRLNGTLSAGQTLHVENVSGDIVATPGKAFSAVVTLTVSAPSQEKADEILKKTEVQSDHDEDGWTLETVWPGNRSGRGSRHGSPCERCRITAAYEIVVPPGVTAELQTVNGNVRVRDLDGELNLENVNGSIEVRGAKRSLSAQTVNGGIDAAARALPPDADVSLQTVNGNVLLTLPKDAHFNLSASTMNGTISSTFPLPPRAGEATWTYETPPADAKGPKKAPRAEKSAPRRVIVEDEDGETHVVDLSELDAELAESMKEVESSIREGMRDTEESLRATEKDMRRVERQMRQIRVPEPHREYSGSVGKGGADVHVETLNGRVLVLAEGTKDADARPLVSGRRTFAVTVPEMHVRVPAPVVAPAPAAPMAPPPRAPRAAAPAPPAPPIPPDHEGEIIRGDVAGDFLSTSTDASYRIGNVSGKARVLTHSGEIHLGSIGAGADLKSYGGDIVVGPVTGELKASTMAGDIRAGNVSGSALADTAGGDIRITRVGGSLDAKTAGGDIVVPSVGGGVRAATAGGDVRIGIASADVKGGVTIHNSGGDVTLSIPPNCKADIELVVTGTDEDEQAIRSDFPELVISKKTGVQRATLSLNGGGEKIVVRTSSGTIRLKKSGNP